MSSPAANLSESQLKDLIESKVEQGIKAAMELGQSGRSIRTTKDDDFGAIEILPNRILPRNRNTAVPNIVTYNFIQAQALAKENNGYYIARMLEHFRSVQSIIDVKAIQHALSRKYDTSKLEVRKDLEDGWKAIRSGEIEIDEFIIFTNSLSDSPVTKYASHLN